MKDQGPARGSDPLPSHDAGKETDVYGDRDWAFKVILRILAGEFDWLVLDLTGVPILTRKVIKKVMLFLGKTDTRATTGRRRVSDLMEQVWRKDRWTPIVHFDLFTPVLGPDNKQLTFDRAGIITLSLKGEQWRDWPQARNWRWPHKWEPGVQCEI